MLRVTLPQSAFFRATPADQLSMPTYRGERCQAKPDTRVDWSAFIPKIAQKSWGAGIGRSNNVKILHFPFAS